jgi:ubiquinone/menaquinone biosynthesis C-methylase UbiE
MNYNLGIVALVLCWWISLVVVPTEGFSVGALKHEIRVTATAKTKVFMTNMEASTTKKEPIINRETPTETITNKQYKKWQKEHDAEAYWFNPVIHTLGNTGFMGAFHAAVGALSTKIIDRVAYKGRDIRSEVALELKDRVLESKQNNSTDTQCIRVLDMACGVGMSTRALKKAFDGVENVTIIGVGTSPEMIEMSELLTVHESDLETATTPGGFRYFVRKIAHRLTRRKPLSRQIEAAEVSNITFYVGNAEATPFPEASFDLVTTMYCFHEVPERGRDAIIKEARRLLKPGGVYAVVDISTEYSPSESMLSGEPYVIEYQQNINQQLANISGFRSFTNEIIEPNQVELWQLIRDEMTVYEANQF